MKRYCDLVVNRIFATEYAKKYSDGYRIGIGEHALRRARERWFKFMDYGLLMDNIHELIAQIGDLDDRLMDIMPEDSFVLTRDFDGLTIFASYAYEQDNASVTGDNADILIYVHTVYVAGEGQRISYDPTDKLLLQITTDGLVLENNESRFRPKKV